MGPDNRKRENMEHTRDEYRELVQQCADQGRALAQMMASNGLFEPLYLYHRPSEPGKPGRLFLARDSAPVPDGVTLTTGEGLRANVPYADFFAWVHPRAKRAPILALPADHAQA
jgi:hypothetical protein